MTKHLFRAIVLLAALTEPAFAATANLSDCTRPNSDPKIGLAACTSAINSGTLNDGGLAAAHFTRSGYETTLKDFDHGLADCDKVISLRKDDFQGYDCRGMVHIEMNQLDLALADFGQGLRLNPRDFTALYNRGRILSLKNNFASAIPDYTAAIEINPRSFMGWNGRCWARTIIGKEIKSALADCNEAIRLNPADANNYNSLGFVNFRMRQYAAAILNYDASIARDPNAASSYYVRGLAKLATGDATAKADIARAKSIEPGISLRYRSYGIR